MIGFTQDRYARLVLAGHRHERCCYGWRLDADTPPRKKPDVGGAHAIFHRLSATAVRLSVGVAHEWNRSVDSAVADYGRQCGGA
jgi:hypothetical protein